VSGEGPASPWQRVHLDELPEIDGPDTLTWRPVRAALGLRAFGTNAYTAANAGDDVVEPHTESRDLAHEELYFVHSGSARFTLDGESFDAPAGTYVRVTDPGVHRRAVALEPGTTVLAFGGPRTFRPSPWEFGWQATATDDLDEARRLIAEGLEQWPASAALRYWRAKVELRDGNAERARADIAEALAVVPAHQREEFESDVRADPELGALVSRLPQDKEE
jgi:hypothetical protein